MGQETATLNIFTAQGAVTFDVQVLGKDFEEQLANTMEDGTAILTTVEGNTLILNGINYVALEVIRNIAPPFEK